MKTDAQLYDVIIVGGGLVGATLACALGDTGLLVAVVEARLPLPGWPGNSRDLRVSAVSTGSVRVFKNLKVWQSIVELRVSPFREMHVWDAGGHGQIHFDSADVGAATLGYIVENRVIQSVLLARAGQFGSIEWLCPERVEAVQFNSADVTVQTESGRVMRSRLLVGADGPDSPVRQLAGIGTRGWDYHQTALVATVSTSNFHRETAWQRFLADGPLAFLPLTEGFSSIVWTLLPERARQLIAMDDVAFIRELQLALGPPASDKETGHSLGEILSAGPRACFPLRLIHANQYVRPRLALVGDAAHTVHPLAGQGVNLGIADAAALAEIIRDELARKRDIGALHALRRYERWRKADNLAMVAALESLKRLFGDSNPALCWLRNAGLQLTDKLIPVKNQIMLHAMGMSGDIPELAREPVLPD